MLDSRRFLRYFGEVKVSHYPQNVWKVEKPGRTETRKCDWRGSGVIDRRWQKQKNCAELKSWKYDITLDWSGLQVAHQCLPSSRSWRARRRVCGKSKHNHLFLKVGIFSNYRLLINELIIRFGVGLIHRGRKHFLCVLSERKRWGWKKTIKDWTQRNEETLREFLA